MQIDTYHQSLRHGCRRCQEDVQQRHQGCSPKMRPLGSPKIAQGSRPKCFWRFAQNLSHTNSYAPSCGGTPPQAWSLSRRRRARGGLVKSARDLKLDLQQPLLERPRQPALPSIILQNRCDACSNACATSSLIGAAWATLSLIGAACATSSLIGAAVRVHILHDHVRSDSAFRVWSFIPAN